MTKQNEITGNAITEREDGLWQLCYAVAYRAALLRGLGFRAARRPARMEANAEITRLRLHADTAIEGMDHADAVADSLADAWNALSEGGPRFHEINGGRRIDAARMAVADAELGEAEDRAIAAYVATVTEIRNHHHRLAAGGSR